MTMGPFPVKYFLLFSVYFTINQLKDVILAQELQILDIYHEGKIGSNAVVSCKFAPVNASVHWKFNRENLKENKRFTISNETKSLGKDPDGNLKMSMVSNLTIVNVTSVESGVYTCVVDWQNTTKELPTTLDLTFPGRLVSKTPGPLERNVSDVAAFECVFEVYTPNEVKWFKSEIINESLLPEPINLRQVKSTYKIKIKNTAYNGIYYCEMWDSVNNTNITGAIELKVKAPPSILIETVKAVGATKLFVNWTVHNNNLPLSPFYLKYRKENSSLLITLSESISMNNTSWVIENLEKSTKYFVEIEVSNSYGNAKNAYPHTVQTLEKDPIFIPNITINGFSATSVTIGWAPPPSEIAEFIHYFELVAQKQNESDNKVAYHPRNNLNLPYMFDDLEPYTTYHFKVRACSEYTRKCGNWSMPNIAMTLDGTPGKPSNVRCFNVEDPSKYLNLTWEPPIKPNAEIKGYAIELTGNSTYFDEYGNEKFDTWGPLSKFVTNISRSVRFDELRPNTNYTVKLCAKARTRRLGEEQTVYCRTLPAAPDHAPRPHWHKIANKDKFYFKVNMTRVTERNGPICCYRVYMVRMLPQQELNELPPPDDISIISYEDAHSMKPVSGAYVTDLFSNKVFPGNSDLIMGDDISFNDDKVCERCRVEPRPTVRTTPVPIMTTSQTTPREEEDDEELPTSLPMHSDTEMNKYMDSNIMKDSPIVKNDVQEAEIRIKDGFLDSSSNYTMFVELIPGDDRDAPKYSSYLSPLMPAPTPPAARPVNALEIALQATCGVLALVLLVLVLVCVLHTRRSRKMMHNNVEMNSLQATLSSLYQSLKGGRHPLVSAPPPDMPPIPREQLAAAYAERQADSDYGFQREFEMLPDCFPDRTTHASEARENQAKNRYPDIKAYDQTRVKLSQIDSIVGSDYINANYVMGYKERKKFICAQGPTDTTVNDFWRMIWEHGLDLIVMLTNLEEYSKVKCSKYWPDEIRGSRAFGSITVQHVSEKRYSDYIVRELKISKQATNSEAQPILESNGIAKKNGDCKDSSPSSSAPTSPRDWNKEGSNGTSTSERIVKQYHFLMWKDFAAPEHAYSILKFIKRVNEAWVGLRAAVVHCSAGVGRTGTLVALDALLQQLRLERAAAVYGCVAELRAQRNFLVQSLKQYVFVYRALVEYAHYGDTEIPASKLKATVDRLRNTPEGADKCLMEVEFEKMIWSPVAETNKSTATGAAEEVRAKNRSGDCLPFDRNRVILTPLPSRDYSTYINASFIEDYDNSESYIITQDPLPDTIGDFWRMVSEHNVATIVMLSELGEGDRKCPRYWDDGTAQYDHISVQYDHSESCPYYTKREFRVTNNKSGDSAAVTQLQYHGWPTVAGQVPEVTRGLAELAAAAARRPLVVHCQYGTERSAMFVALCVLIAALRAERRVDVSCVARKVRCQRARTLDTFLQYEFLHRAILNYAELHNLLEDS